MQMIKGNHEMRKGKVRRARGFIDPNILNAEVAKTQTQKDKVENAMAILNARLISNEEALAILDADVAIDDHLDTALELE